MSFDADLCHAPPSSMLPAVTGGFPAALAAPGDRPPLHGVCHIVGRMTNEMAALVAERVLHRRDRRRTLWHLRQIAMYVCHVALQISVGDIADAFGRNRSTVAYAVRIVEDRRDDKAYDDFVGAVERIVNSVFSAAEVYGDE